MSDDDADTSRSERKNRRLTEDEKDDARVALRMLHQSGKGISLTDAARIALASVGYQDVVADIKIEDAVERFMRAKRNDEDLRPKTVRYYEDQLGGFADDCPWRRLAEISPKGFSDYIAALTHLSRGSKGARARAVRALCNFGRTQSPPWIAQDPGPGLVSNKKTKKGRTYPFFKVPTARRLFQTLPESYLSAAAIALFVGVRPEEIRGPEKPPLDWSQIDFDAKCIRINAEQAKTGKPRLIEMIEPVLWRWLEFTPKEKRVGPVQTVASATFSAKVKELVRDGGASYIQDISRHTYATYHLALTRNPGLVAMALGHKGDPQLLHDTYAGVASRAQAEEFFGIGPECRTQPLEPAIAFDPREVKHKKPKSR